MEYRIAPKKKKKKVKTRPYSIFIQKWKGSSAFDEQKVKNIAIEYWLQSIFPNPENEETIALSAIPQNDEKRLDKSGSLIINQECPKSCPQALRESNGRAHY